MNCGFEKELLSAYLDNELLPAEVQQVKDHLRVCAECVRDLKGMQSTIHEVRQWPAMKTPAGVTNRIRESIGIEPSQATKVHAFPRRWVFGTVAAAAMTLIGVTVVLLVPSSQPAPDSSSVVARSPAPSSPASTVGRSELARESGQKNMELDDRAKQGAGKEVYAADQKKSDSGALAKAGKDKPSSEPTPSAIQGEARQNAAMNAVILTVASVDPARDQERILEAVSRVDQNRTARWQMADDKSGNYRKADSGVTYLSVKCDSDELKQLTDSLRAAAPGRVQQQGWNEAGAANKGLAEWDQLASRIIQSETAHADKLAESLERDKESKVATKTEAPAKPAEGQREEEKFKIASGNEAQGKKQLDEKNNKSPGADLSAADEKSRSEGDKPVVGAQAGQPPADNALQLQDTQGKRDLAASEPSPSQQTARRTVLILIVPQEPATDAAKKVLKK